MRLYDLLTCSERQPLGLDEKPYFSWKIESEEENTFQTSWRIIVRQDEKQIWDSGIQNNDHSVYAEYRGIPLKSAARYTWSVEVTDNHGNTACESSWFETAFFYPEDWKAVWVENAAKVHKREKGFGNQPAPTLFRRTFTLPEGFVSGRLYATCHGIYEASINGRRTDDRLFAPEYTSYDKYLCYQTYDITRLLKAGDNALGMYVADGWYFSPATTMNANTAKKPHAVLYQIEVVLKTGAKLIIASDGSEKTARGPVCFADLFAGEQYDARVNRDGWDTPGYDDQSWQPVNLSKEKKAGLRAQTDRPVKAVKEMKPVNIYVSPKGENIIDFGQVMAGHVRFHVNLPAGRVVTLEHFETTDQESNYFNNIIGAAGVGEGCDQKVVYISDGKEAEYEAKFSFHGFRYVRVSGLQEVKAEDFTAVAVSSEKEQTGTFECSDARINRLYENTRWSQRSNMISIPTDCPQREKAGWTGDIGIYAPTSLLNEDTTGLLKRWLRSLAKDQYKDGAVPIVVPNNATYQNLMKILLFAGGLKGTASPAGWADAAILVPLAMYEITGNTAVLKEQYSSMKAWADFIIRTARKYRGDKKLPKEVDENLWNTGFHFGEWLIPSTSKTSLTDTNEMKKAFGEGKKYIPETYGYLAMKNMAKIAEVLGNREDSEYYSEKAKIMRQAFIDGVISEDGKMPSEFMGAYIIPLHYGLVPDEFKESFMEIILRKIRENNGCLDTGFLGTPVILDALSENGKIKETYDLLFNGQCPSWLYEVDHGATTIWESWISENEDGSPIPMSLNHYTFGCVDDWMFRHISGIIPTSAGFKTFMIKPANDARLTSAYRSYESVYGKIVSEWKKEDGIFRLHVMIPANTKAEIILPDGTQYEKGSGTYTFTCKDPDIA